MEFSLKKKNCILEREAFFILILDEPCRLFRRHEQQMNTQFNRDAAINPRILHIFLR